jgi:pimeloyl-ACP methyl ester carboxylesterase
VPRLTGRLARTAAWAAATGAAAWLWRHATAPAAGAWRPGAGDRRHAGPLAVRVAGDAGPIFLLLHGLAGSGEIFGAGYDALAARGRVVVPDLLGFGRSMDHDRLDFGLDAHLEALDQMAEALGLADGPWVVGGHSMGGLLGLHWAARHPARVERVVTWGMPLYRDDFEAARHIRGMGTMARLFAMETPLARRACAWMCEHRGTAAWVAIALNPGRPVTVARHGVLHTWPSYLGGMNGVILHGGWEEPLRRLDAAGVPVVLAAGARDRVPVPGRAVELAARYPMVQVARHPTADHDLPLTDPAWCVRLLRYRATGRRGSADHSYHEPS